MMIINGLFSRSKCKPTKLTENAKPIESGQLLKTEKLTKQVNESNPTIRDWTKNVWVTLVKRNSVYNY